MDFFWPFISSTLLALLLGLKWWEEKREKLRLLGELTVDPLTPPLLNKRGFFERGGRVLAREQFEKERGRVGIAYFDLNGFKEVNDRLGHAKGDEALKLFARLFSNHFRESDVLARMGGDEFAGVFPRMEEEILSRKCSALVAEFECLTHKEFGIQMSASFCALSFAGENTDASLECLVNEADRGMQMNKPAHSRR